ncbi:hypothetical protein ABE137_23970 [Brevibacillus laterosporus]|uniref:Uncharacterized protein n=1 Tax=Brevibacillus halotolerans TaxID=1507437 RepID=A0ABT4HVV2_9BACL|nr:MULTISPECIES: hypothetical protein [Brevibacillus]MCR8984706.1 hypothetical protein [Brevibacillus laterosporus]MCZ0830432.1 hypothetical protein [Brevibacillus halotolerans]
MKKSINFFISLFQALLARVWVCLRYRITNSQKEGIEYRSIRSYGT